MSTTKLNISINEGTDYYLNAPYMNSVTNLTNSLVGYSAVFEVRRSSRDTVPLLSLSDSNGRILLTGTIGDVIVHFLPADTDPLQQPYPWTKGWYTLKLTDPNGVVTVPLAGMINIVPGYSNDA